MVDMYEWVSAERFLNRTNDLAALESWWSDPTKDALAVVGRRRVGKSWLLRRFAHGKPSLVLVADELLAVTQMDRFARELEPILGVRPRIDGVADLVRVLLLAGEREKMLVVIDEFPLLLPDGRNRHRILTETQAILEQHRDGSLTKLVLCGSLIGQMEGLMRADSPLHGRLRRLDIHPLTFPESRVMTDPADSPTERVTRFAVVGGIPRYLGELGIGALERVVCDRVLDRNGPLFNDPRSVLEQELREPAMYMSILSELARRPASNDHLAKAIGTTSSTLAPYLKRLGEMRLVTSMKPVGAPSSGRKSRHTLVDGFARFWFRFVLPHQDDLQTGLTPDDLWRSEILPDLADFTASAFEELCAMYVRSRHGAEAPSVGPWWGNALNHLRRAGDRTSEEIDVIGAHKRNLRIICECKWTNHPMALKVLTDLRKFKLPAVRQEQRLTVPAAGPKVILFSRSGFAAELEVEAAADPMVELVDVGSLVRALDGN